MSKQNKNLLDKISQLLHDFCALVCAGEIEIYNEFSLQHELGIFLRQHIQDHKIRFEKNIGSFGYDKKHFEKREIDITILDSDAKLLCAIELKFPRNGQVPEQMFNFCKDIVFLEQLKKQGVSKGFFLAFSEDKAFYSGKCGGIYRYFRGNIPIEGKIQKPTGTEKKTLKIIGTYVANWEPSTQVIRYCLIEVEP